MKTNFKRTLTAVAAAAVCAATMCSTFSASAAEIRLSSLRDVSSRKIESVGRMTPDANPDDFPVTILPYIKAARRVNLGSKVNLLDGVTAKNLTFGKQIEGHLVPHIIITSGGVVIVIWTNPPVNPYAGKFESVFRKSELVIRNDMSALSKIDSVAGALDIGSVKEIDNIRTFAGRIGAASITNLR